MSEHLTRTTSGANPILWQRRVPGVWKRSYEVLLLDDLIGANSWLLAERLVSRKSLLVSTPTVTALYARRLVERLREHDIDISLFVLPVTERSKTMDQVMSICDAAYQADCDRKAILIGMGGGVCTDLVTMAASLIRRGIAHIRIPTTLLGQVDGGIGIKGAVNFHGKKNSLGCFYTPEQVFIDPCFLPTLGPELISLGFAEILKMALVCDPSLFETVEEHSLALFRSNFSRPRDVVSEVLQRSILGMLQELETNLYEDQTCKRLVDFGHTFGPALEATSNFSLPHGSAVAVDMALSCQISVELGLMDEASCDRVLDAIVACRLPVRSSLLTVELAEQALDEAMLHRGGELNLVLPTRIGTATFVERRADLPRSVLLAALGRFADRNRVSMGSSRPDETCLVFDVGGTNLRAAIYRQKTGQLGHVAKVPTPNHIGAPESSPEDICQRVVARMEELAGQLVNGRRPETVSIAFAGPLDGNGGVVAAPTIWGPGNGRPIDLIGRLQPIWPSSRILLLNDVTAAGYRYLRHPKDSLCVLAVGSGIGNKVFIDGKPHTGPSGRGGEIGHFRVDSSPGAPLCDCGARGHLGAIASGRGTLTIARSLAAEDLPRFSTSGLGEMVDGDPSLLDNIKIVDAFHNGDPWACEVIQYVAGELGSALASLHLALGIERFVVYGGFALALGEGYRQRLVAAARDSGWASGQDWNDMVELGDDDDNSGLIGAGRFAGVLTET